MITGFLIKHKRHLLYGAAMAGLLFVLKWLELRLLVFNNALEIYIGAIAFVFTALGIWLALKLSKPKIETVVVEKEIFVRQDFFSLNQRMLSELNVSKRELEVLQLMSEGLSNDEIADRLFISLSTVKTHSRNLFEKLGVTRRTQAVDKAKKLCIIP